MAGIVFPDVAGSGPLPAIQIQKSQQLMDLEKSRQDKLDAEQQRQQAAGQYVPGALAGDQDAFNNLAKYSPDLAIKLRMFSADKHQKEMQLALRRVQKHSRPVLLRSWLPIAARSSGRLSGLPDLDEGSRGVDVGAMPQQYSPAVDSLLNYHANVGAGASKLLELRMKQPGVLPDGGGAPGAVPAAAPPSGGTGPAGNAISGIESAGQPNGGYGAIGPAANKDGNRAYGKYQVMDFNIPTWTKEVIGEPMTPQQFLANPQAQDAVFNAKFGQYTQKYGPEGAARGMVWRRRRDEQPERPRRERHDGG